MLLLQLLHIKVCRLSLSYSPLLYHPNDHVLMFLCFNVSVTFISWSVVMGFCRHYVCASYSDNSCIFIYIILHTDEVYYLPSAVQLEWASLMNLTLLQKMRTGSYTLASVDGFLHSLFAVVFSLDSSWTVSSLLRLIVSKSLFTVNRLLHFRWYTMFGMWFSSTVLATTKTSWWFRTLAASSSANQELMCFGDTRCSSSLLHAA